MGWTKMPDGTEKFLVPALDGFTWFVCAESDQHGGQHYWEGYRLEDEAVDAAKCWMHANDEPRLVLHGSSWEDAKPTHRITTVKQTVVTRL